MSLAATVAIALLFLSSGCTSPGVMLTRGSGPGAGVGNRGRVVRMHEGANPSERTPRLIPTEHSPLDPSRQAEQFGRR